VIRRLLRAAAAAALALWIPAAAAQANNSYAARPDVQAFVADMVARHGFPREELDRMFVRVRHQPSIIRAMTPQVKGSRSWVQYRGRFLTRERIDGGVAFWARHEQALARAWEAYGVPPQIVVAIIGVETEYGRMMGGYRVADALATLAFDYPRRAPFFRGELKEFVVLAHEQGLSPLSPKGSFAGAMGLPQFMPGSYRRYAIDFDDDGRADLWASPTDVIGSVANYLARHDWMPGQPVLLPAAVAPDLREGLLRKVDGGISERRPLAAWAADGVAPAQVPADLAAEPVGLLLLEEIGAGDAATSLWIACPNFYVITRYNRSRLYASAVWALAQRLRAAQ